MSNADNNNLEYNTSLEQEESALCKITESNLSPQHNRKGECGTESLALAFCAARIT